MLDYNLISQSHCNHYNHGGEAEANYLE